MCRESWKGCIVDTLATHFTMTTTFVQVTKFLSQGPCQRAIKKMSKGACMGAAHFFINEYYFYHYNLFYATLTTNRVYNPYRATA